MMIHNNNIKQLVTSILTLSNTESYDRSSMSKLLSQYSKIRNVKKEQLKVSLINDMMEFCFTINDDAEKKVKLIINNNQTYIRNKKISTPQKNSSSFTPEPLDISPIGATSSDYYSLTNTNYNVSRNLFPSYAQLDNTQQSDDSSLYAEYEPHQPLNIHMFFYGEIPDEIQSNIKNTIEHNPNNKIILWTNKAASNSISHLSPQYSNFEIKDMNILIALDANLPEEIKHHIQYIREMITVLMTRKDIQPQDKGKCLSDILRLLALYQYSGLYLDVDVEINEEINSKKLFKNGSFQTHLSFRKNDEGIKVNVDYYDSLAFQNVHDNYIKDVLIEIDNDLQEGYLNRPEEPGELVRIITIIKNKLQGRLGEITIDDIVSEENIALNKIDRVSTQLSNINIKNVIPNICFKNMK